MKKFKAFLIVLVCSILVAGLAFCLTALIVGTKTELGFVGQIQQWFGIVKEVTPPAENVGDVVSTALNIFR